MLRYHIPDFDWKPWLFRQVPNGFWQHFDHCRDFCEWFAERHGVSQLDQWYNVSARDLNQDHGAGLMAIYNCSVSAMLADVLPNHNWLPSCFVNTPDGFWHVKANRLRYLKWLGKRLGYNSADDWYQLSNSIVNANFGGSLFQFGHTIQSLLRELKPQKRWLPWKFRFVPDAYWKKKKNRLDYLQWLGKQLGYRSAEDWLAVTQKDFAEHRGAVEFQFEYQGDAAKAIHELYPDCELHQWQLKQIPVGSWDSPQFCHNYLDWSAKQLGLNSLADWYTVTATQMRSLPAGGGFLRRFRTLQNGLAVAYPEYDWLPWMFGKIPDGFWSKPANVSQYLRWLGNRLGFESVEQWQQLTAKQLRANHGGGLIMKMKVPDIRAWVLNSVSDNSPNVQPSNHSKQCGTFPAQNSTSEN